MIQSSLIVANVPTADVNAKLTGTFYGERFCEKIKRSGMHKNERSKMFPRAALCYALLKFIFL